MTIKAKLLCLPLVTMMACGGGDDGLVTSDIPTSSFAGNFYSTLDSGAVQYLPSAEATGWNAQECRDAGELKVFETSHVRVFGLPELAENDFRLIAEYAESGLTTALSAFELSINDFMVKRPAVTGSDFFHLQQAFVDGVFTGEYDASGQPVFQKLIELIPDLTLPENWQSMVGNDQSTWFGRYFYHSSRQEQLSLVEIYQDNSGEFSLPLSILDEKLFVCMTANGDVKIGYGEGHVAGMNILAPSSGYRKDARQIMLHEAVHTVQSNLSSPNGGLSLHRWYAEGQAVFIAGQEIAKPAIAGEFNPIEVKRFFDEIPGDNNYSMYGLAYQYVHETTGTDGALALFNECRNETFYDNAFYLENPEWLASDDVVCFNLGFDETVTDPEGLPMTLEDYRINWETRMQNYQE